MVPTITPAPSAVPTMTQEESLKIVCETIPGLCEIQIDQKNPFGDLKEWMDSDDMLVDVTTSGLKGLGVFTYWLYGFSEINSYETNALRNYRRFEFLFGSDGLLAIENAADYERIKHFVATVVITARLVAQ